LFTSRSELFVNATRMIYVSPCRSVSSIKSSSWSESDGARCSAKPIFQEKYFHRKHF